MLAKGLEIQISSVAKAEKSGDDSVTKKAIDPEYYGAVIAKVKGAYRKVWDILEANEEHLSSEIRSWRWDGDFSYVPLSHLATPDGAGQTESNALQLWSLAILALERKRELEG